MEQKRAYRLLLVDQEPAFTHAGERALRAGGFETVVARDEDEATRLLAGGEAFDLALLGKRSDGTVPDILKQRGIPALFLLSPGDRDEPGQPVQDGGCLYQDCDENSLLACVDLAVELHEARARLQSGEKELAETRERLKIQSDIFEKVFEQRQQQLIQTEKLASLGVLVAGVAHEINNPNQAIRLSAQVLLGAWSGAKAVLEEYYRENGDFSMGGGLYSRMREKAMDHLRTIQECSDRINNIVMELKDFAQQDRGEEFYALDFNLVVKSSLTLVANMLKNATNKLTVELAPSLPQVRGNFQRLEQVIINLIQNACQSLPDPSRGVFMGTSSDEKGLEVVFEIIDQGSGISSEDLSRIRDPFFTTKRDSGGTGLGLSIAATILEQHGGRMEHNSVRGEGTAVVVSLPALGSERSGR